MKYVLLGNLSPEYANKQSERVGKAKAQLDKLGIKIESIHYTQGYYGCRTAIAGARRATIL